MPMLVTCLGFFASVTTHAAPGLCAQMFNPTPRIERHALIQARSLAIVEHQNRLRAKAGLSPFEIQDYQANLKKRPPTVISSDKRYVVVKRRLVLIEMTDKIASTALLVDDVHSLNYVYRFDGPRMVEASPAAAYYISQMPEVITLTRGLSSTEAGYWKNEDLPALRSHSRAIKWGYAEPVAHFSVGFFHHGKPTVSAKVPREVLLRWAEQNLITIGSEGDMDGKPFAFEIVIKHDAWEDLLGYMQKN